MSHSCGWESQPLKLGLDCWILSTVEAVCRAKHWMDKTCVQLCTPNATEYGEGTSSLFLGCQSQHHHSPGQARAGHFPWQRQQFGAWKVPSLLAVLTVLSPRCGCWYQLIYNTCSELRALEKFVLLSPAVKESVAFPSDKSGKWWQQSWGNR